jgi:hypothetical protein
VGSQTSTVAIRNNEADHSRGAGSVFNVTLYGSARS